MGPSLKFCAALAVAAVASMPASAQGIVAQKNISLAVAQTIANAALAQCEGFSDRCRPRRIAARDIAR
jgi:hypothetical protein